MKRITSERGAALLIFVVFFLFASLILVLGIGRGAYENVVEARTLLDSKRSFYAAEAGIEDAIYRHRASKSYSSTESFTIDGNAVETTRTLNVDVYDIVARATAHDAVRRSMVELAIGDGASFNFGLQSGNGGIRMFNSSSVKGNVFSNGPVEGSNNTVYGEVVSAGPSGLIDGIHATGSAWSHTISSSNIDKDAYYTTLTGTIVGGNSFPGSPDQATSSFPISDEMIEDWKTGITNSGTIIASTSPQCAGGTYIINSSMTLGNTKVDCNVEFSKNTTSITLTGPVWIAGNLTFTNGPSIIASSSLGAKSVQLIVDKESNRTTSSKINVQNATNFTSGNAQSYVLIVSMNNSAEMGGSEFATEMVNSATGKVLFYAPHGLINLMNNISLKEVTAYKIATYNSTQVVYESGLASLLFTSGPGGGYTIAFWREI